MFQMRAQDQYVAAQYVLTMRAYAQQQVMIKAYIRWFGKFPI